MRLTVSQLLARLTDCATNTFWGDALLGDTSLTAGAASPASWHFVQLSVDPENGARPSGVKEGLWLEPAASGRSGRQDQVGGWNQRRGGEEGGVSSKSVKKGGVSRRVGGMSRHQQKRADRNYGQERRQELQTAS